MPSVSGQTACSRAGHSNTGGLSARSCSAVPLRYGRSSELRPYLSGTAEHARADSPPVLECPALLQAVWPDTDGIHLAVGLDDGVVEQVAAVAPAPDPFALRPVMV